MSELRESHLAAFSDEITALVTSVVRSTATISGQNRNFEASRGSAWLYKPDTLVTNNHVVWDFVPPITAKMADGSEVKATLVGRDPLTDLAVLNIPKQDAPFLQVRPTSARLGELCFAIGTPHGYAQSVSIGIVSGLRRNLPAPGNKAIFDVIQTDCAINHGNSGGPLIDVSGAVIGVNFATESQSDGIGWAIPGETVSDIASELITHGVIDRASLGISVSTRAGAGTSGQLVVTDVGSAPAGDLRTGDVLLQIGPHELRDEKDLVQILRRDLIDKEVPVLVSRNGQRMNIAVTPAKMKHIDES